VNLPRSVERMVDLCELIVILSDSLVNLLPMLQEVVLHSLQLRATMALPEGTSLIL